MKVRKAHYIGRRPVLDAHTDVASAIPMRASSSKCQNILTLSRPYTHRTYHPSTGTPASSQHSAALRSASNFCATFVGGKPT